MVVGLTEVGKVQRDLGPLIERLQSLPPEAWVFRNDPESDKTKVIRESSPHFPWDATVLLEAAMQILPPGYANRIVLSCVPAGEGILPHTDDFGEEVRSKSAHYHLPITTEPSVVLGFDDGEVHMRQGVLYRMDETRRHYVRNPSSQDRVHLLFAHFPH